MQVYYVRYVCSPKRGARAVSVRTLQVACAEGGGGASGPVARTAKCAADSTKNYWTSNTFLYVFRAIILV